MAYDKKHCKPLCHNDCWHYSVFGGVEGCGQREEKTGNPWPEPVKPPNRSKLRGI